MIRLIIRRDSAGVAAHVGGSVLTTYYTIDLHHPELEALIDSGGQSEDAFEHTQLIGCEIIREDHGHG
jgi:hypothetical protein